MLKTFSTYIVQLGTIYNYSVAIKITNTDMLCPHKTYFTHINFNELLSYSAVSTGNNRR